MIRALLHSKFMMIDVRSLHYFVDISVTRDTIGMHLSQVKYAVEILDKAGMIGCN
jgi:hypothetical protein